MAISDLTHESIPTHCAYCGTPLPENCYAAQGFPYLCCSSDCLDKATGRLPAETEPDPEATS